jgi:hypothetical protein
MPSHFRRIVPTTVFSRRSQPPKARKAGSKHRFEDKRIAKTCQTDHQQQSKGVERIFLLKFATAPRNKIDTEKRQVVATSPMLGITPRLPIALLTGSKFEQYRAPPFRETSAAKCTPFFLRAVSP